MSWTFRDNSLDAIRLFAATQVAVLHTWEFMYQGESGGVFFELLRLFPGVPIFFFISGYLISRSYERSPALAAYWKNRFLRLYPALVICVFANLVMVAMTGYLSEVGATFTDVSLLFLAKTTFLQFYNPEFMRAFGDGVLNGSLWTICVELQFYFLTPVIYFLFSRGGKGKQIPNIALISLIILFVFANRALFYFRDDYSELIAWKLYRVSFAPWIYMFLCGILVQRNFDLIAGLVKSIPTTLVFFVYLVFAYIAVFHLGLPTGNEVSPILFLVLVPLILRMAYTKPVVINSVMKGNDISYGIYIWHMPIVNQMLYWKMSETHFYAWVALILSILAAVISWVYIEKPALGLKNYTVNNRAIKRD